MALRRNSQYERKVVPGVVYDSIVYVKHVIERPLELVSVNKMSDAWNEDTKH